MTCLVFQKERNKAKTMMQKKSWFYYLACVSIAYSASWLLSPKVQK